MDAVEEVKSRLNIEDVVGEYVQLKRSGRNFKGLSPFSSEKTPSFVVSPEKQIWHDFSSGKGGNMFSFVMEMEGLDFKATLELLARKAGVDLTQYNSGRSVDFARNKERLYKVLERAGHFYQVQFSKNKTALEYVLKQRQFSKQTALEFQIGYSPNNGRALTDYLVAAGFSEKELASAGLITKRFREPQDMFRGRLMIPLHDAVGRVIGFTARLLVDNPKAPKYINTPATILYDKGRHVYGLHLAKEAVRSSKYAVLVEGNLDVIASHQAGIRQVVATAGTALTESHLKALQRLTPDVRLAFDQDAAGQAAAERAIPIASKTGVSLSMVIISGGKDPDELVRQDPAAWQKVIDQPEYALDWLIKRYQEKLDLGSAPGKRQFSDVLLGVISKLDDRVEQDHYLSRIAETIGVSVDALNSKMKQKTDKPALKRNKVVAADTGKQEQEISKAQDQLLAITLLRPKFRKHLEHVHEKMLIGDPAKAVWRFMDRHPDFSGDAKTAQELKSAHDYVKILTLQYEALYKDLDEVELAYQTSRLKVRLIELFIKQQKTNLAEHLRGADEATTGQLLKEVERLDRILQSTLGE